MKNPVVSPLVQLAAIVIIFAGLMAMQSVVLPIIMALFISIICMQPILWITKHRISYFLAVAIVLILMAIVFVSFGGIIGNSLAQFSNDLPKYESNLKEVTLSLVNYLNAYGADIDSSKILETIDPGKILNFTTKVVGAIGGIMSDSFIILFITIFMLLEGKSIAHKVRAIESGHGISLQYFNAISANIRRYLSIKTIISLLTGVFIWLWLLMVGVDNAVLWGLIAFLLNYIPTIGSLIAAAPTMLLALVQLGTGGMVWTGVGYLIVNTVMGSIIEPKVMGRGLGLSTLVVFLSLIVWGYVFGAIGMFLSVPFTMAIKIILENNEKTKWIAVLIGTEKETKSILN